MKKLLITATILSMLPFSAYARNGATARLSGIYQSYDDIKVIHNVENATDISWQLSRTETGTYTPVSEAEGDTYTVAYSDAGKWIMAVVTDAEGNEIKTEPRRIQAEWSSRQGVSTIRNVQIETPTQYLFSVDGMDFVLLDVTEDEEAKYLVMSKKSVGNRKFTDMTDNQYFVDMIAFLNNQDTVEYYYGGNKLSIDEGYGSTGYIGNTGFVQLPQKVLDSIDYNRLWKVEPVVRQAREFCYRGGIVVPSVTDVTNYAQRFGWKDDSYISEGSDEEEYVNFWLRTPNGSTAKNVLYANTAVVGGTATVDVSTGEAEYGIRPMFYLEEDFFVKAKVENAGSEVLNTMWNNYSKDELLTLYTNEELTNLGYIDFTIEAVNAVKGEESSSVEITVESKMGDEKDVVLMVAVYDSEGMLSGVNIDTVTCVYGNGNKKTVNLTGVTASGFASATVAILESLQNPAPMYKVVTVE